MALGCLSLTTLCPVNLGLLVKHKMAKSEGFFISAFFETRRVEDTGNVFFDPKSSQNWVIKCLNK